MLLTQMWNLDEGNRGIKVNQNGTVSLTAARSEFLPPHSWKRILLPYKAQISGGVSFLCGLSKSRLVAGLTVTKGAR